MMNRSNLDNSDLGVNNLDSNNIEDIFSANKISIERNEKHDGVLSCFENPSSEPFVEIKQQIGSYNNIISNRPLTSKTNYTLNVSKSNKIRSLCTSIACHKIVPTRKTYTNKSSEYNQLKRKYENLKCGGLELGKLLENCDVKIKTGQDLSSFSIRNYDDVKMQPEKKPNYLKQILDNDVLQSQVKISESDEKCLQDEIDALKFGVSEKIENISNSLNSLSKTIEKTVEKMTKVERRLHCIEDYVRYFENHYKKPMNREILKIFENRNVQILKELKHQLEINSQNNQITTKIDTTNKLALDWHESNNTILDTNKKLKSKINFLKNCLKTTILVVGLGLMVYGHFSK